MDKSRSATPDTVVRLLQQEVAEKGQSGTSRGIGITQSAIHRYLKGIGYPNEETFRKMSDYFGMPVWVLRGEEAPAEVSEGLCRLAQPYVERYKKITGITELPEGFSMEVTYRNSEITSISINGVDVSESDLEK